MNEVLRHAKIIEGLCNGQDILSLLRQVQCIRATNEGIHLLGVILEELAIAVSDFTACHKKYMDDFG